MDKLAIALLLTVAGCAQPVETPAPTKPVKAVPKPPVVSGPKLMPVDEAPRDPTLVSFRNTVIDAIQHQDAKTIADSVDPKIRTSFGDDKGGRNLNLSALEHVLALGGTFQKESDVPRFWAPYVYSAWPESHDAFSESAVIAADVPLHQSNDPASPSVATLQYDIVNVLDTDAGASMRHVRTADKREGWVESQFLRSSVDYRAALVKRDGRWKIETFVAGD
jgi:hypothetical protein